MDRGEAVGEHLSVRALKGIAGDVANLEGGGTLQDGQRGYSTNNNK